MQTPPTTPSSTTFSLSRLQKWLLNKTESNPLWQNRTSIGLRRRCGTIVAPTASIRIEVRDIRPSDAPLILPSDDPSLPRAERNEIARRRKLLELGVPRCFVAIDSLNNRPCFIQWAFSPSQNDFVSDFFHGRFPQLTAGQILLENAYTPPEYRGKGIMPDAMNQIATLLFSAGATEVITFVDHRNAPSLKGCAKAGFEPYLIRRDLRALTLFKRRRFISFPAKTPIASPAATFSTH